MSQRPPRHRPARAQAIPLKRPNRMAQSLPSSEKEVPTVKPVSHARPLRASPSPTSSAARSVQPFQLSRRTFLRGAGAAIALPFLDAMAPRAARAQQSAPGRFFAFYVPNGIHMPAWTPTGIGASFALSPILEPLSALREDILVLSGLHNIAATAQGDGPGDHARGTACFLTCAHPEKTQGSNIFVGPSVDQRIAEHLAGQTTLRSLELGCEGGGSTGGCDSGYSCAYTRNISWRTATTPVAKEINPRSVFDRLFTGFVPGDSAEVLAKKRRYRKSILDFVLADAQALSPRLGRRDRAKLDEYLTGVRELETRIEVAAAASTDGPSCEPMGRPNGIPVDAEAYVRLMLDLVVLAFRCDLVRVGTFMLGNGGSNRSFGFIGVPGAHHELSHHQNDPAKHAALQQINLWEVQQLAYLLDRLKEAEEGEGSVLDRTLVLFSSEVSDGNSHSHYDLPVLVAGGRAGLLQPGRHIDYPGGRPVADLYLSLLQRLGVPDERFGDDGTAPLVELS